MKGAETMNDSDREKNTTGAAAAPDCDASEEMLVEGFTPDTCFKVRCGMKCCPGCRGDCPEEYCIPEEGPKSQHKN